MSPPPMKPKLDSAAPSITPQRKHRKLLKDGSGTEVWPEAIEKVFVQGLKEYWDSPYATYSQSRGRSRWRNQFLVDYLHKHGVERSKKQVASHIQVLRNMWKGEPEYVLVAGGDELYPDNDSPVPVSPIKLEDHHYDHNNLVPFNDWDDSDHPNPVSPDFSPADSQSEFPPTPKHHPNLFPSDFAAHPKLHNLPLDFPAPGANSPSISPEGNYIQSLPAFHDSSFAISPIDSKYQPVSPIDRQFQTSYAVPPRKSAADLPQTLSRHSSVTPTHQRPLRNKITSLYLHADGMTTFSVKVDALTHPSTQMQPPFALRIKLCVPLTNDARSPPSFHGFVAGIVLEAMWSSTGRCITRVYENNVNTAEDMGFLNITHVNVGAVNALLPESQLTRCRWLSIGHPVTVTQEIVVDNETLLYVVYELDRRNAGPMPSASLLGYQKYRTGDKGNSPMPTISPSPSTTLPPPHTTLYGRPAPHHPSFSSSPMRYASSSGLNF